MRGESGLTASDVALLSGRNGSNDGFGEGSGWWIIVFLIFALGGWGNGFGGNRGNGSTGNGSAVDGYVLATDFANIERKIDGVNNGLCDGFYAMAQQFSNTNQNIANATSSLQNTLCQGFNGLNVAYLQGTNSIQSQLANGLCDIREGIQGVNYNISQTACGLQNTMNMNTRDIVDTVNANYRALHDEIVANRIEDKNAQITAQQNEINALRLSASQSAQNEYLLNQLRNGCPVNAQLVCGNTPIPVQYIGAGCGCNTTVI